MSSFLKTAISVFLLASSTSAAPGCPVPTQSACSAGQTGNVTTPVLYDLYASSPDLASDPAYGWHLESYGNRSQHEQLMYFPGIPTGTKTCQLKFYFANLEERVFIAKGSGADFGYAKVRQIPASPATGDKVTYNTVENLDDGTGAEASNNVQNWDLEGQKAVGWTIGSQFDCSKGTAFRFWFSNVSGRKEDPVDPAHVFLGLDAKNGFVLSYTC